MAKAETTLRRAKAATFTDGNGVEHQVATLDAMLIMAKDFPPETPLLVRIGNLFHPVGATVFEFAPFGGMTCAVLTIDEHGALEPDYPLVEDEEPVH